MNLHHFFFMARWARNPPSARRVKIVLVALAICLVILGIEYMGWWPDWARTEPRAPARLPRTGL